MTDRGQVAINPLVPVTVAISLGVIALTAFQIENAVNGASAGEITVFCAGVWGCGWPTVEWLAISVGIIGVLLLGIAGVAVRKDRRGADG